MKAIHIFFCAVVAAGLQGRCHAEVQRVFRPPSYTRGNAGLTVRYDVEREMEALRAGNAGGAGKRRDRCRPRPESVPERRPRLDVQERVHGHAAQLLPALERIELQEQGKAGYGRALLLD